MQSYDLGNRIYELRKAKCLSQKELGEMLGVSNKSVSKWENGVTIPKTETLVKLAQIFGISTQELLQGKTDDRLTLSQLSSKVNEMLLTEEIQKRNEQDKVKNYQNSKKYLITYCSLLVVFFVVFLLLSFWQNMFLVEAEIDAQLQWYEIVRGAFIGAVLAGSVFSGIVFAVRAVKKLPAWCLVLMCILFPITILLIEIFGLVITPKYLFESIRNIVENRKNGHK